MKAIILAAGQGTRLRPHTNDRPKCMVEVGGKSLLAHICDTLNACGVSDRVIVCGYRSDAIPGTMRKYLNPRYEETNMVYSLFCAEEEFNDDLLIVYGDIFFAPSVLRALCDAHADVGVVVDVDWHSLWKMRMDDPLKDAESMKLGTEGNIVELGRHPRSLDEIQGQYIGLIKISKKAVTAVRNFYHSLDRKQEYFGRPFEKMHMTDFIQLIIDRLMPVKAVIIHGGWCEIDSPRDKEIAEKIIEISKALP